MKDIATPCLMSQQIAAKQIGKLENAGFVARTRSGRNTFCELAEPLMRICIEVKGNKTGHFRLFVEFLRLWFTTRELQQRHGAFHHDGTAAVAAAREALAAHPDNGRLLYELAHAYFAAGSVLDALDTINRVIALDPENPANHCYKADILLRLKRFEEAIAEAETVLVAEPNHGHSFGQIMEALVGLERTSDAEARASDIVRLAPDDPRALVAASRFHVSHDRLDRALELADRTIDIDADHTSNPRPDPVPDVGVPARQRGSAPLRRGHPRSVRTHCRLADALLYGGEVEEAVQVAVHLLHIDPGHDHAHHVRGRALMELGRAEAAIAAFDKLMPTTDSRSLLSLPPTPNASDTSPQPHDILTGSSNLPPTTSGCGCSAPDLPSNAMTSTPRSNTLPSSRRYRTVRSSVVCSPRRPPPQRNRSPPPGKPSAASTPGLQAAGTASPEGVRGGARGVFAQVRPRHLAEGLTGLRLVLGRLLDEGVLGAILTDLLIESIDGLAGALHDWETAIDSMASSLDELPDCRIPLQMLRAAVQYAKTADEEAPPPSAARAARAASRRPAISRNGR